MHFVAARLTGNTLGPGVPPIWITTTTEPWISLWIAERSARRYFLEFTQRLNAPIAMYMAENAGLVTDGALDPQALSSLAEHVMMINPSVEVYVLDLQGRVMAQAASANVIAQPRVSMQPIREAIRSSRASNGLPDDDTVTSTDTTVSEQPTFSATPLVGTLLGDNPLDPDDQRPFSVHPLEADGKIIGNIYALLAGREHQNLLSAIRSSHSLRDLVWILSGVLVLAGVAGSVVFFSLTRRLRSLDPARTRCEYQRTTARTGHHLVRRNRAESTAARARRDR